MTRSCLYKIYAQGKSQLFVMTDDVLIYLFFRPSLLIRLRLVVPFASLIWEHPKEDECDILEWIRVLVPLLVVSVQAYNSDWLCCKID
jgi:hypothetical protein